MFVCRNDLSGYVLAGGRSSRFGRNKALALIEGKSMLTYSTDLLKKNCASVCVNRGIRTDIDFPDTISDLIPDIGPMGGIYSCLKASSTEYSLILTCDMPFLTAEMLDRLIQLWQKKKMPITLFKDKEGNLYPFPGIYSKACIPVLRQLIPDHNYKIKSLIHQTKVCECELSDSELKNMINLNYADPSFFE